MKDYDEFQKKLAEVLVLYVAFQKADSETVYGGLMKDYEKREQDCETAWRDFVKAMDVLVYRLGGCRAMKNYTWVWHLWGNDIDSFCLENPRAIEDFFTTPPEGVSGHDCLVFLMVFEVMKGGVMPKPTRRKPPQQFPNREGIIPF